jgi:hypothetical protein
MLSAYRRRQSWINPEIRILAPSMERGIDDDDQGAPYQFDSLPSIECDVER